MPTPFDFINSITYTKVDMSDSIEEYNAWMVNRGLSNYIDTILFANEMNINYNLSEKAQYLYLLNIIGKKKRFGKWPKAEPNDNLDLVSEYYQISRLKAAEYLKILTPDDLKNITSQMETGGTK